MNMNIRTRIDFGQLRERARWCAYAAGRRLGVPGLAAVAVLAAVPVACACYFNPETERLDAERAAARKALAAIQKPGAAQNAHRMTLRDVQKLRVREQAYSVFELLEQNGIARKHATYRHEIEATGKLRRLTIDIAASGPYAGLREALRAIADQPMARVESVALERDRIDTAQLEINLRVSLLGPDA